MTSIKSGNISKINDKSISFSFSKSIERRLTSRLLSPYMPEFHTQVLLPLKQRYLVGAPQSKLSDQLYFSIHSWLNRFIATKSRNLPASADLGELESRVHESALLACRSLDWNRTETFAPLLRLRIEGATIESARHDDWLSRRHRKMLNSFRTEVDERQQKLGRELEDVEKREIAKKLSPDGARINWESDLQKQFAPQCWNEDFDNTLTDTSFSPEDECVNSEYVSIVHAWLDSLPEGLGDKAYGWAMDHVNGNRGAPRPIIRQLKKHIPALLEKLGSHYGDQSTTRSNDDAGSNSKAS